MGAEAGEQAMPNARDEERLSECAKFAVFLHAFQADAWATAPRGSSNFDSRCAVQRDRHATAKLLTPDIPNGDMTADPKTGEEGA